MLISFLIYIYFLSPTLPSTSMHASTRLPSPPLGFPTYSSLPFPTLTIPLLPYTSIASLLSTPNTSTRLFFPLLPTLAPPPLSCPIITLAFPIIPYPTLPSPRLPSPPYSYLNYPMLSYCLIYALSPSTLSSHQLPIRLVWLIKDWGYTHDGRADNYPYPHDRRADKDSYPHDRNVTGDLCSLIKLCFAFIMVNFRLNVLLLFLLKIIYFKRCLNH